MNVPGFNAEASLYQTSRCYRGAGGFEQSAVSIQPAYNCFFGCYLQYRHCLSQGGSPIFCRAQQWICLDNCTY
jgi:hypothetical protein